jgi:hypothetical protein
VLERDEGVATHVPVSSLLSEEELAKVERAFGHVVWIAEREERLLLYVTRANGAAAVASASA